VTTRLWTRCRRTINGEPCNRQLREHDVHTRACPGGTGATFLKHAQPVGNASQSFSRREVEALVFALKGIREGKDLRIFARASRADLLSLERKTQTMRASLARRHQQEDPSGAKERKAENDRASTAGEAGVG
jgi:hypothetical protein